MDQTPVGNLYIQVKDTSKLERLKDKIDLKIESTRDVKEKDNKYIRRHVTKYVKH